MASSWCCVRAREAGRPWRRRSARWRSERDALPPPPPPPTGVDYPVRSTHDGTALPTLRGGAGTTRQSSLLRATVFYP